MSRATHMLILVLVLGAVVAGALPPAPATAGPLNSPLFPFPEDDLDGLGARLLPPPPAPPADWADQVAGLLYHGILKPVLKLLLLL